jgi:hypothetical protein
MRLADLRGKVVLLNFWATWCMPCRQEMPALETLYQRYKDAGLVVLAVNMDRLSTAGVEAFVQEVAVTFPIVLDPAWATAQTYRVLGLPTTYLIDRAGNVVVPPSTFLAPPGCGSLPLRARAAAIAAREGRAGGGVWLGGGAKMPFELPIHRPSARRASPAVADHKSRSR